jgi:AraC-like DNA-binding protein
MQVRLGMMGMAPLASNFAQRFRSKVGVPPLDYLLRWRMRLARRDLLKLHQPIAQVAQRYGYGSESAFGNAFKRVFGTSPRRSVVGQSARPDR